MSCPVRTDQTIGCGMPYGLRSKYLTLIYERFNVLQNLMLLS